MSKAIETGVLVACLFLCVSVAQATESITVAVASSLYTKMQTQAQAYEKEHGVKIRLISGSTGRLYNQIIQGAPFDVFIAADDVRPEMLLKQGKAITTYVVGQGYLGLIVDDTLVNNITPLTKASIQHIAIANPDVAPFGLATKKVLQKQGLWEALKSKFVYAQNALQAQMLVQKGLVDAGFIPVVGKRKALAEVPYVAVLLSDKPSAQFFYRGLTSQIPVIPAKAGMTRKNHD
ncbi:MAG: molybdate ABC transporter substrate-binding protein [Mariprofundaceae bacterium]|nr:molybdate ABC transporter substrate-binding protein [Mariprofundaceae bacterium]